MKISKKFLVMLCGAMLVGCTSASSSSKKGNSSEQPSNTEPTSQTTSDAPVEKTNFEKFKGLFDSFGTNYTSIDYYYYMLDDSPTYSASNYVVEPHAMLNMATRSGIALAKVNNKTQGYRYGVDVYAAENESAMLTSYKPASYFYQGFMYDGGARELDDAKYALLFGLPNSDEISSYSKGLGYSDTFDTMFTEGATEEGAVTFTTTNLAVAINLLENNAFGRMEGFASESYLYNVEDILFDAELGKIKYNNLETIFTMVDNNGLNYLDCSIFAKDSKLNETGTPFMQRLMIPMEGLDEDTKTAYGLGLNGIVPSDFYEKGPGAEPNEVAQKRVELVNKIKPMIEGNNFTISHTGGALKEALYTAKVYDDHTYTYEGNGFAYGYYYLEPTTGFTNVEDVGIRVYSYDAKADPAEEDVNMLSLKDIKATFEAQGYTVDTNYIATKTGTDSVVLSERMLEVYQMNFNRTFYLGLDQFWDIYYGYSWADLAFYNPVTDSFLISDYYLKTALFGADTITANFADSISLELFLGSANTDPYASALLFDPNSQTGFVDFGTLTFSNVGTTKTFDKFATYVNAKHGTTYPVEVTPEPAA